MNELNKLKRQSIKKTEMLTEHKRLNGLMNQNVTN